MKSKLEKIQITPRNLNKLRFDNNGLIPAIVQDYKNKDVLMMAFMNIDSLKQTLKLGKTCFWSRSRKEYWVKGMTSGHFQFVKDIYYDCDCDCLLITVKQIGAACHTMLRSCFYRKIKRPGK
ncbi:MAG: phosphoribosyl-AMP cyclohydrolase [Candidatus Omnitrophota bacterium]|nr:phosphoribosyl-AMP cyclohydrolase [Candidatus Omnitrophota bacterium]MDZ4243290.1 phosphoribosyl-AMP cyclohydrolase [Candidatus Omnitrophota bacterium]